MIGQSKTVLLMKSEILGTSAFFTIALIVVLWSTSERKFSYTFFLDGCDRHIVFQEVNYNEILYFGDSILHVEAMRGRLRNNEGLLVVEIPYDPLPNPGNDIDFWWRVRGIVGDSAKRFHYDYNLIQDVIEIRSDRFAWEIYEYCPNVFLAYYKVNQ